MRRLFAVLTVLMSCSAVLLGQRTVPGAVAEIHGQVVFSEGHQASNGVLVTLEGAGSGLFRQVQTDDRGKFEFSGLVPERYKVKARFPGYLEAEEGFDLTVGRMGYAYLTLKPVPGERAVPPKGQGAATSVHDADVPEGARKEFDRGQQLLNKGKEPGKSVQFFQKAIKAYPNYSDAYLMMGIAYSQEKKWNEASAALQKAVELDPNHAAAYIALGGLANLQGKPGEAEKPLLKALEFAPNSSTAHFELARAYWAEGRWQDADPHAVKTLELQPDNVAAHILMGNILLRKRDAIGALREFKESLRLDPKNSLAEPTRQIVDKIEAALKNPK